MSRSVGPYVVLCCAALSVSGCKSRTSDRPSRSRAAITAALDKPAVLATIPEDAQPPATPVGTGLGFHPASFAAAFEFIFSERGGGVAYVVAKDDKHQVVHNGRVGKPYEAVRAIALSPDGRRCAYGALVDGKWRMIVDGAEGQAFSAVGRATFSPDGAHVAYQAMAGELWHLVVDTTVNPGTRTRLLTQEFSADSSRIAFIDDVDDNGRGRLVVSDLAFKQQTIVDASASSLVPNADRSRIAAVTVADDRQRVLTFAFDMPDRVKRWPAVDGVEGLTFGPDGLSLAFAAGRSGKRIMVLDGEEAPLPDGDLIGLPVIRSGGRGLGVLVASGGGVHLQELFSSAAGEATYEEAEGLVYSDDGRSHAYAARRGERWFIVAGGREGPPFDRVVTPVFSPDGRFLVYRARKDGKRFVVVADTSGKTIRQHPDYEQVFPVLFTGDGKSAAYGVKDGSQLAWKVEGL